MKLWLKNLIAQKTNGPECAFPLGTPVNEKGMKILQLFSALMVGKCWMFFHNPVLEDKWVSLAFFKVLQALTFFATSLSEYREDNLTYVKWLWNFTAPKIYKKPSNLQMLRGQAI